MSAGDFHGIVNGSIGTNGTASRGSARGRGARRVTPIRKIERAAEPELAAFVKTEWQPQDAPMWPIHAVIWLQPELRLRVPVSSGLRIERQHRVPSPDFARSALAPRDMAASLQKTLHPVLPRAGRQFPASGLAPQGWDPRVASPPAGREDQK